MANPQNPKANLGKSAEGKPTSGKDQKPGSSRGQGKHGLGLGVGAPGGGGGTQAR